MSGGIGSRTFGILEHKGRIVSHLAHQAERQPVVILRLTAISHKDVGGDGTVGDKAADGFHTPEIPFAGVLPVHPLQHIVASALHGQVDMAADIGLFGYHPERVVAHVLGM